MSISKFGKAERWFLLVEVIENQHQCQNPNTIGTNLEKQGYLQRKTGPDSKDRPEPIPFCVFRITSRVSWLRLNHKKAINPNQHPRKPQRNHRHNHNPRSHNLKKHLGLYRPQPQ